jgi:beta-lactam-binding protein with PASTA domain
MRTALAGRVAARLGWRRRVVKRAGRGVAVGRVLSTSPKAGARKPNGTKVKLIVRK